MVAHEHGRRAVVAALDGPHDVPDGRRHEGVVRDDAQQQALRGSHGVGQVGDAAREALGSRRATEPGEDASVSFSGTVGLSPEILDTPLTEEQIDAIVNPPAPETEEASEEAIEETP